MKRIAVWAIGVAIVMAGCKLTPDYERPELDPPPTWLASAADGESIANLEWWEIYDDETMSSLIEQALAENQDLAVAMARMQEAAYLVTFTRADQFPFLDIFGSAGRGRQSKEINPFANTNNNFALGANLSFEIDLWRKYSRATEAARADLLSSEAAYRNVTISLVADVASTYLLLRDLDARLEISRRTAKGREHRLEIVRARFEKGTEARLDVNQAEVQLAIAEASVAQFERLSAQAEHALRVLVGRYPGPIPRGEQIKRDSWPLKVPAGLPSELLTRRPDIVEAEQRLIAETARIGVAQAMRFPSLSLTAQVSAVAEDLTDLNSTDAGEWNIMAGIFQPIFNSGQLKAQMKAQTARAEQAHYRYVGALQNAFREVEDSLVAIETYRDEHAARQRQVKSAANAARLSQARYDGGVVDYLEVLDSERTLFDAELQESAVRRASLNAFVQLYKALGGGWSEEEEEEGPTDREAAESEEATDGESRETPALDASDSAEPDDERLES
jgi:multidrug efflux system outer membrane protein